ncbi:16S rRNA (uracil(1498)-N(3))-methyltransferase [Tunicatimonas pelagia]|uniref:16S rRNA (uracil(1498)-N(3))-methyltransferase n=1 Tax=Tunicatimonas pelagia TaxID=931531 RepID=UPI00266647C5|nr:16S rRNA (uracil(1498)-N(3))-methyltransferase [Tunicatimonas pelagia]WKN42516.1 16S rRNA (uracil(1498)-N(3))-methyltransferase [Tunicatimonas pelagia]
MATFYQPDIADGANFLGEEESRHCAKVLRLRPNDTITVVDGKGTYYQSVIQETSPKRCTFSIVRQQHQAAFPYSIHLLIAPTKNLDRTEWMVEKLTEIGVDSIQFVECDYSERRVLKLERLQRKAVSAMKQSGRALLPALVEIHPLTSGQLQLPADSSKFIAHIDENHHQPLSKLATTHTSYVLLVGPEGGFSPREITWATEQNFQMVSLGQYRLRTETAGLVGCQTLHTVNQLYSLGNSS